MNANPETAKTALAIPAPNIEWLVTTISNTTRWRMLKEMSCGEARSIGELAEVGGVSYAAAAKHLLQMCRAGVVVCGRGHLYQIPKAYLPTPGQPVVDFGHCLLRLDAV